MKIFISQPMRDKTNEEIQAERDAAISKVKDLYPHDSVVVLDTFFKDAPHDAKPLFFLGKSIQMLGNADLAVFIGDWKNYRGCSVENVVAEAYGIKTLDLSI